MEIIKLLAWLGIAWLGWRYILPRMSAPKNTAPPPTDQPATPGPQPQPMPRRPEAPAPTVYEPSADDDKSTGRSALRQMCRDALADKAIDHAEALTLLQAFEAYSARFRNTSTHIEYIRHELFLAVEDGQIDPQESQELVTLLGEFADLGLYGPIPDPKSASAPAPRAREPKLPPTTSTPPSVMPEGRYLMTYTNADGETGEREIKPKRIERRGEHLYLVSYCLKARGPLTFRVDRIESLVDAETGEILVLQRQ